MWTLEEARRRLQVFLDAEEALALGKSYSVDVGGSRRQISRADERYISERIQYWKQEVERLERGGTIKTIYTVPTDR